MYILFILFFIFIVLLMLPALVLSLISNLLSLFGFKKRNVKQSNGNAGWSGSENADRTKGANGNRSRKQKMFDNDPYYGIQLAGPVANDIMTYIYDNDPTLHAKVATPPAPYSPTNIKAGNSKDVTEVSRKLSAHHSSATNGKEWSRAKIDVGGNSAVTGIDIDKSKVPDVRGMGLSDALYLLESLGMKVTHSGHGAVRTQSIEPGASLKSNNRTIHLTLK
jgi:hypothetical protein